MDDYPAIENLCCQPPSFFIRKKFNLIFTETYTPYLFQSAHRRKQYSSSTLKNKWKNISWNKYCVCGKFWPPQQHRPGFAPLCLHGVTADPQIWTIWYFILWQSLQNGNKSGFYLIFMSGHPSSLAITRCSEDITVIENLKKIKKWIKRQRF